MGTGDFLFLHHFFLLIAESWCQPKKVRHRSEMVLSPGFQETERKRIVRVCKKSMLVHRREAFRLGYAVYSVQIGKPCGQ